MKNMISVVIITLYVSTSVCLAGINNMTLVGKGEVRYLGLIKVYEATLYTQDSFGEDNILNSNTSKCLQLEYAVSLSVDDFIEGANTILSRQHSLERLDQFQPEIDLINNAYKSVKEGDKYVLCYDAGDRKTTLILNDQQLVSISSPDFSTIYFGIWLGPVEPIDEKLRDNLLADQKN